MVGLVTLRNFFNLLSYDGGGRVDGGAALVVSGSGTGLEPPIPVTASSPLGSPTITQGLNGTSDIDPVKGGAAVVLLSGNVGDAETLGLKIDALATGGNVVVEVIKSANNSWIAISGYDENASAKIIAGGIAAGPKSVNYAVAGNLQWRVRQSAWTSGTTSGSAILTKGFGDKQVIVNNTVATTLTSTTLSGGQAAHSAAVSGNPIRVGGKVVTAVDTTLVASDTTDLQCTSSGAAVFKPYSVPEVDWQATSGLTPLATTTLTSMQAAKAAGIRNYVTGIQLVNTSATVSTTVTILDGSTVLWAGFLPATTAALPEIPIIVPFPTPLKGTAATAINIQLGTTSASVYWNAQGYAAP